MAGRPNEEPTPHLSLRQDLIIAAGPGFPNRQVLDPLHIGQTVNEVLDGDLALELAARALYEEAATYCHSARDYVSRDLFEALMANEEEHIDFLETQLDLVAKLGLELYAQHHIGKLDAD